MIECSGIAVGLSAVESGWDGIKLQARTIIANIAKAARQMVLFLVFMRPCSFRNIFKYF